MTLPKHKEPDFALPLALSIIIYLLLIASLLFVFKYAPAISYTESIEVEIDLDGIELPKEEVQTPLPPAPQKQEMKANPIDPDAKPLPFMSQEEEPELIPQKKPEEKPEDKPKPDPKPEEKPEEKPEPIPDPFAALSVNKPKPEPKPEPKPKSKPTPPASAPKKHSKSGIYDPYRGKIQRILNEHWKLYSVTQTQEVIISAYISPQGLLEITGYDSLGLSSEFKAKVKDYIGKMQGYNFGTPPEGKDFSFRAILKDKAASMEQ